MDKKEFGSKRNKQHEQNKTEPNSGIRLDKKSFSDPKLPIVEVFPNACVMDFDDTKLNSGQKLNLRDCLLKKVTSSEVQTITHQKSLSKIEKKI